MPPSFLTTRWTRILAARGHSPDAQQALSDLCALNYTPVLRFLTASGHDPDDARELTHEFFAHVLEHHSLDGVDPARGRFRTYLLGALKHFASNRRAHASRQKRGGGAEPVSLDATVASHGSNGNETQHATVPEALRTTTPDAVFDREWALGVIERALAAVEQESAAAGTRETFQHLRPWLSPGTVHGSQADAAAHLGLTEGAAKVAIHRLRKRFREAVRREVAQTLHDERDLPAEMQHLIAALSA